MKRRQLLMAGALVLAAGLAFFPDLVPDTGNAEAVARTPAAPRRTVIAAAAVVEVQIAALRPRAELTDDAHFAVGSDAFLSQSWIPPAPKAAPAPAAPAPTAPPLPFTYIGKAAAVTDVWEVFLARGEQTYVVRKHTLIDAVYRVENIAPPIITLTYLPLNQIQQLNIGVPD